MQNWQTFTRNQVTPASHSFDCVKEVSLLTCTSLCSLADGCVGVGFHSGTMSCEFSNKSGEYLKADNYGWFAYSTMQSTVLSWVRSVLERRNILSKGLIIHSLFSYFYFGHFSL